MLSVSSVGPGIFAITKNADSCIEVFEKNGMNVYKTKIENGQYKIIKRTYLLSNKTEYPEENSFWNNPEKVKSFVERKPSLFVKSRLMEIKNHKNKKALDLGCGGGRYTQLLAEFGYDAYTIDANTAMIDATKKRLTNFYNKDDIEDRIKKASILQIPHKNEYFDVIVSTGVFHQAHCYSEYEKIIKETSRVLKKGGIIITEIFTSKVIDPAFKFAKDGRKNIVITNEGLYMTLLSKAEYLRMMKKYNLVLKGKTIEKAKIIETGRRCLLQACFVKR